MDNLSALWAALPAIGGGVLVTLTLTVGGALLALIVAVVLGLSVRAENIVIRGTSRVIIEFFRGTSLVVQLFFLFFVLPQLGVSISPIACGILGLGLNYGAYGAEVIRGSINSVPTGQWEATTALSMTPAHRMRRVIFPQAWALMIPSLTNLLIQLLKGTAIVGFITLIDLTVALDRLRIQTDTFFYGVVGMVLYFVIAYALTLVMNALEVRAKHKLGRGESLAETLRFRSPVTRGETAA
ncbi:MULTISPECIES: amino acid ABC transporter permease [Microbacterium]|uniref:Amino acid ABC transporter permease n=1 Tax=Microbacterium aurugineum TaxID=2851642 RepID=A0ABY4J3F3_9MICO|nr:MULTISPECIES: amino acid ABC transporter permease [Microbacterium]PKQ36254.1 MAG: ectoine/hydroxyectoine ABC transporter permease subunit EhuC [Actinobacteria bacterium HGW-Actinobacteria-11]MCE0509320.1 amino acid ABC transporter permease [Microbacterium sp. KKR3/1]MCK8467442.1 amino acid ABC transporter permease [Microbacterium aurugineum]MCK8476067.1 amino acid ABC transporter permease [Microbacterium aurugineum]MCZ4302166.1 amino acid ABC transporter permease [Microbacterium oxydans]